MAPPAAGKTPLRARARRFLMVPRWWWLVVQDLLISLKMLAVKRAETAGRPHLADAFDLRTLRALGTKHFSSDSEVFRRRSKDQAIKPTGVKRKRKQMQDGRHGEAVQRNKKRRKTSERR
ncbi:hypothetical protein VPH35_126832 [Triticum aestivum]